MTNYKYLSKGWHYTAEVMHSNVGSICGDGYIKQIEDSINALKEHMNSFKGNQLGLEQLGGFVQEIWSSDTLNISEAINGVRNPNNRINNLNTYASPDITLSSGKVVSSKAMATASKTAAAQSISIKSSYDNYLRNSFSRKARTHMDYSEFLSKNGLSGVDETIGKYNNQIRLVPSDQESDVRNILLNKIEKSASPSDIRRYKETLENTTSVLRGKKGAKSLPISKNEGIKYAAESQKGIFDPGKHGVSLSHKITVSDICKASIKAGLTAALISTSIELGPVIIKTVDRLVSYGEIDLTGSIKDGALLISNSGESFLLGSLACAIHSSLEIAECSAMACNIAPAAIGIAAVFCLNAIRYSIELATGKITAKEMQYQLAKQLVIAGCTSFCFRKHNW